MKKVYFGMLLFIMGGLGYILFSLYLSMNPFDYNGLTGTYAALLGNELLIPYVITCATGLSGLGIMLYELYFRHESSPSAKKAS